MDSQAAGIISASHQHQHQQQQPPPHHHHQHHHHHHHLNHHQQQQQQPHHHHRGSSSSSSTVPATDRQLIPQMSQGPPVALLGANNNNNNNSAINNLPPTQASSLNHHQLSQLCNGPHQSGQTNNNNNTTTNPHNHTHHHQYPPLLALQQNFSHLLPPSSYAAAAAAAAAVVTESAANHHHQQQQQALQQHNRRYHSSHQQQQQHQQQLQHNHLHQHNNNISSNNNNSNNHLNPHHHHHSHQSHHRHNAEFLLHEHLRSNNPAHLSNGSSSSSSGGSSSSSNSNNIGSSNGSSSSSRNHHHNWRQSHKSQACLPKPQQQTAHLKPNGTPHSLLDLSAKIVAEHVPFQSIELRYEHIPEPVQRQIIFWSFPRHEEDIKMYSSLSSESSHGGANGSASSTSNNSNHNNSNNNSNHNNNNLAQAPPSSSNNAFAWMEQQPANNQPIIVQQHANSNTSSSSSSSKNNHANKQITFHKGLRLYNDGCVHDVLQVGFNLSGLVIINSPLTDSATSNGKTRGSNHNSNNNIQNVNSNNNNEILNNQNLPSSSGESTSSKSLSTRTYRVSVTFDRCKITSVSCSCELQDIFWCEHVVALTLFRIRNPETIDLRVPISETLLSLDRQQLQKLVQYIIAEHHTEVLPTAQRLLDEMRQSFSEINKIHGAPDPTAGASANDEHIWHLDEDQVNEKVQNYLNLICSNSKDAAKQIHALFEKIREMFQAKDSNGSRLLKLITEQFLLFATRNEKSRPLWDQLVSLWVVVMLNPDLNESERNNYSRLLIEWSKVPKCPKEDIERRVSLKRKVADFSDDEDSDEYHAHPYTGDYQLPMNQSNNYPAHMATHRHRTFQPNNGFPVLRPFNQLPPILPSSCPCQISHSIAKKIRGHRHPHHENEAYASTNRRPSSSSIHSHSSNSRALPNPPNVGENRLTSPQEPRSVFYRALDFKDFAWNDPHLQLILNKDGPIDYEGSHKSQLFDFTGNPLWNEAVSQAAARVETLRSHGYKEQALRLAVATVRELKIHQDRWCFSVAPESALEHSCISKGMDIYSEGWIGHPFDPISVLMDILLEASTTEVANDMHSSNFGTNLCSVNSSRCSCPYNQALADFTHRLLPDLALSYQHRVDGFPVLPLVNLAPRRAPNPTTQNNSDKTPYFHVPVPGCCQKDSYLTLAVEIALIALGQQRSILTITTAHERAVRQEAEIIAKLDSIDTSDPLLIDILKRQANILLDGGPFRCACCGVPTDSAPLHTFARYLFDALVSQYRALAYKMGVYALKQPLLLDDNIENYGAARASPRSINLNHLQSEQLLLAQTMLSKAKEDGQQGSYLGKVYRASIKNIRNPASLLKLSKHTLKEAKPSSGAPHQALLDTAFNFGLQVLRITLSPHTSNGKTRKEAIQFMVECATDIGLEAVLKVMRDSGDFFSALEALNLVVTRKDDQVTLRSHAISKLKLKDNPSREAELNCRSRELALDCARRDPTNCALDALAFCETDKESLKKALEIVIEAGINGAMDSTQLIKVADHIDKGRPDMTDKAFEIAMVAVDSLSIPSNSDNISPKKDDLMRACEYAKKVNGFSTLIPKLINNIECATVLSEIYNTFSPNQMPNLSSFGNYNIPPPYQNVYNKDYILNSLNADLYHQREDITWWDALLKRTLKAFVDTTRVRLQNISPRHYSEFINFLIKASETFEKAADGPQQFKDLISEIMKSYRTKKKLMERLKARFDYSVKSSL